MEKLDTKLGKKHAYGAAIVLLALWLGFWAIHFLFSYHYAYDDAMQHGQTFQWGPFMEEWLRDSFENLTSEMFQVLAAAWVFKHFLWKDSPESRESTDQDSAKLDTLEQRSRV